MRSLEIAGRRIGPDAPCFVIAEAGVNHNGRRDLAEKLVDAAAEAGADAVKFQTFRADLLATPGAPKAEYQKVSGPASEGQREMLRRLELSRGDHEVLMARCRRHGLIFLSSPFDDESAELLDRLGVPAFKLGSGELTNLPFLARLAGKGRPLLLSTGMADLAEVERAVNGVAAAGGELALLHCVSNYPAKPEHANLRAMRTMQDRFHVPVGFSDHTLGPEVALAAAALGARILEKHLTLDKRLDGPDHRASAEPSELAALIRGVRIVESALGHGRKEPAPDEATTAAIARKSLVAAARIPRGTVLSAEHVASRRPGTGIPPSELPRVVGRRTLADLAESELLTWEILE